MRAHAGLCAVHVHALVLRRHVAAQVLLDQLTFGPAYNLAFMSWTAMVVQGERALRGGPGVRARTRRRSGYGSRRRRQQP
jgi:hypothetical protein